MAPCYPVLWLSSHNGSSTLPQPARCSRSTSTKLFAHLGVAHMIKRRFAIFFLFVSSLAGAAELAPRTKEYDRCIEKAGAVDPLVLECISDEYTRQDKRLNAAYRKLMGSLKGERKKQLLEAQRLWG